jgi:phosphonate transport system substrate-binding protein
MRTILALIMTGMFFCMQPVSAAEYQLAIQPISSPDLVREGYQPLADYLSKKSGHTIRIQTFRNFLTYWEKMKKQRGFDLVLDAAHFTDFRVKRQGYTVLAKLPDTVSFTVVTGEDSFILGLDELISKKIATMPSPGLGALRLAEIYTDPIQAPFYIQSSDAGDAIKRLMDGRADAAIIPTRMVAQFGTLNTVDTTEPVPHMAFSASPDMPRNVVQSIKTALLEAPNTEEGRAMIEAVRLGSIEAADSDTYDGYAELLQGVFGY